MEDSKEDAEGADSGADAEEAQAGRARVALVDTGDDAKDRAR